VTITDKVILKQESPILEPSTLPTARNDEDDYIAENESA
jgi:hypothetical protein